VNTNSRAFQAPGGCTQFWAEGYPYRRFGATPLSALPWAAVDDQLVEWMMTHPIGDPPHPAEIAGLLHRPAWHERADRLKVLRRGVA
jgi:hypothetical protein